MLSSIYFNRLTITVHLKTSGEALLPNHPFNGQVEPHFDMNALPTPNGSAHVLMDYHLFYKGHGTRAHLTAL